MPIKIETTVHRNQPVDRLSLGKHVATQAVSQLPEELVLAAMETPESKNSLFWSLNAFVQHVLHETENAHRDQES